MAAPAGQHETDRGRVDARTAAREARQTGAVGGQLERFAQPTDPVAARALVPLGEPHRGRGAPLADLSRARNVLLDGTEAEVTDPQHALQTRLADVQGGETRDPFPVLEPHGHEGTLLQIHDGADPETRDQLRAPDAAERFDGIGRKGSRAPSASPHCQVSPSSADAARRRWTAPPRASSSAWASPSGRASCPPRPTSSGAAWSCRTAPSFPSRAVPCRRRGRRGCVRPTAARSPPRPPRSPRLRCSRRR